MATQASLDLVQYAYIAFYGRPADKAGQDWWAEQLDTNGGDLSGIIDAFSTSPEYDAQYGALTNVELVEALYQQILGREADVEGRDWYVEQLDAGTITKGGVALAILNGPLYNPEAAADDAATLANRKAIADEFTAAVESADKAYGEDQLAAAKALLSAVDKDTVVENVNVDGTVASFPAAEEPTGPGSEGETFELTDGREGSGRDVLTGTDGDDEFVGLVGQNSEGAIANAFSTGDMIDGGAGRDTIEASLIADNEVDGVATNQNPRPITENVEEVYIEALETVTLDATRMEGVEEFWSNFSRGAGDTFTVTGVNLRGSNLDITKDVTFGIKDTMHGTNFTALFDSLSLTREAADQSNSQLLVRIADVSTETPDTPLANVNLNLSFDLGDVTISLEDVQSTDGTYAGLVEAIQDALALEGYAGLTVELSTPYTEVTFAGNTVVLPFVAQEILVTDPAGNAFDNVNFTQSAIQPVAGGFLVAGNAQPLPPGTSSNLIESNLVLDNAGNGSLAGDVVIGGMSNSDLGVERINVMVDRSSKINSLNTTNDALQEIHISSLENQGDLYIGSTQSDLNEVDANAFAGSALSLGEGAAVSDLDFLDASGTSANITFVADYDGNGRASSEQGFVVNTGSGNDSITAELTGTSTSGSTQASLSLSSTGGNNTVTLSSTAVEVNEATVTLGAGADTVTGGMTALTANTGAGNDTIYAENTGAKAVLEIDASSGQLATVNAYDVEFLFGKQVQVTLSTDLDADGLVVGFESELIDIVSGSSARLTTVEDLNNAILTAINDDPELSKLATASVDSNNVITVEYLVDGVQLTTGVEVKFFGKEWADLTATQQSALENAYWEQEQNSTIDVEARYDAAVLVTAGGETTVDSADAQAYSSITVANYTAGETINITIDGTTYSVATNTDETTTAGDIVAELTANGIYASSALGVVTVGTNSTITTSVVDANGATGTTTAGVAEGLSSLGTDSLANNVENVVNAGSGNDVIVLSSDDTGANNLDTVEFNAGNIGNNTIVHFEAGANADILDFSAWLNNVEDASANTNSLSEARIAGSDAAITAFGANTLSVTDFTTVNGATTATLEFATMTDAQVLAALNANATFGSADMTATDLVGDTANSILLVENVDNKGEYKVYQVTSEAAAGTDNFTDVTLVGTVDFGATLPALDATNIL